MHFVIWCSRVNKSDAIMSVMASEITSLTIDYSTVYSDQTKHQSSASLPFVRGIHRWPVNFPHIGPVTRKMFPFDDVIKYLVHPSWLADVSTTGEFLAHRASNAETVYIWWRRHELHIWNILLDIPGPNESMIHIYPKQIYQSVTNGMQTRETYTKANNNLIKITPFLAIKTNGTAYSSVRRQAWDILWTIIFILGFIMTTSLCMPQNWHVWPSINIPN